jgi:hypothetical protein
MIGKVIAESGVARVPGGARGVYPWETHWLRGRQSDMRQRSFPPVLTPRETSVSGVMSDEKRERWSRTMEWQPLKNLKLDGRQVMFKSESGEFEGPAVEMNPLRSYEAAAMYKANGSWPQNRFTPTHWREIEQ